MNYYIIGTTAINRPILHNDNIKEWSEWLMDLNSLENVKLKWYINIDVIESLPYSYEETRDNLKSLLENEFELIFLESENKKGNFLEACRRLSQHIEKDVSLLENPNNITIIWLEDDWKLNAQTKINICDLIRLYKTEKCYINLSFIRNNYIWALAPSIISYSLWKELHYNAWNQEKNPIDPEHCVGLYYHQHFGNPKELYNLTVIHKKISNNFFQQSFMNYPKSYYTYHNDKFKIQDTILKYIPSSSIQTKFQDKIVFIRMTPSFCIDGCNYGRKFLEKFHVKKSHMENVNEFYSVSSS